MFIDERGNLKSPVGPHVNIPCRSQGAAWCLVGFESISMPPRWGHCLIQCPPPATFRHYLPLLAGVESKSASEGPF